MFTIKGIIARKSTFHIGTSVTSKKWPNVYKSCPKMKDFDTFKKCPTIWTIWAK